jgi:plastocyanin
VPTTNVAFPVARRQLLGRVIASGLFFSAASRYAAAADAKVMIDNFTFSPTPLIVARGTSVVWENREDIPHAIYFPALNMHSKVLDTNDAFRHRFDQGGTFDYICSIRPHMRGRIVVSD